MSNYKKITVKKIRDIFTKSPDSEREKRTFARKYAKKAKEAFDSGTKKMGKEAKETQEMAASFYKLLEHKLNLNNRTEPPTEEEVKVAIEQLKDVGRVSFFATISILPGGAVSIVGLEMLAAKFGLKNFTFIPSAFRKNADWHYPQGHAKESDNEPEALKKKAKL